MKDILQKISKGIELGQSEIDAVIFGLKEDCFSQAQIAGFLMALLMKGPTVGEITAIVRAMRKACIPVSPKIEEELVDTCGTGGGLTTFNVSTANALLAAAAGVKIAKHGSRSISASSGSADVLEALGIEVELEPAQAERLLEETGFSFLYAPYFHPVMMKVFGPENDLGIKTIFFTIIGPLINPAGAKRHLLGVYQPKLLQQVAEVAAELDFSHVMVVHGADGLDEISPLGETLVAEVKHGSISSYTITPEELGMRRCTFEQLRGGTPQDNARIILDIFSGKEQGPRRDMLLLNAGATLFIAGKAPSLREGVDLAQKTLDSGEALAKLQEVRLMSQKLKGVAVN